MSKTASLLALLVLGCNAAAPAPLEPTASPSATETAPAVTATPTVSAAPSEPAPAAKRGPVTYDDDLAFLKKHGDVIELVSPGGGRVAVSAKYQGRVMTSAVGEKGQSLGFVFRKFIEEGKTGTQFDNYGGEDRFWLGPEAGQYGLYFPKGKPFTIAEWKTPDTFQTGTWDVVKKSAESVVFKRAMKLENYSGTPFELEVARTVELVPEAEAKTRLGIKLAKDKADLRASGIDWVAFKTTNELTNTGSNAWTKDKGLLSVWILGMYNPSPDTKVVIPFEPKGTGEIVNDRYFGKVPADRLKIDEKAGVLFFTCDAQHRSKIGLGPARARPFAGSYSASAKLLTIVEIDPPSKSGDYVNSMWETQKEPYKGDVINSYNDGPTEPGKASLGGFYELESSSRAAALAPKGKLVHTHRTYHFVGEA
ncbi:MAG: hypothetical protein JNK04_07590, partial [Myxococcales bacterium]|nr:hypothetical protein [Myxococcales bacterium]